VAQKLQQAIAAQRLESGWRKDQILEAYLNLVPFRGELVGIDALSQSLFGKVPQGLDEREAALASALVRAPNAKTAQVVERACSVLVAISGKTDCEAMDLFATAALQRRDYERSSGIAPHLARQVVGQVKGTSAGGSVTTTLRASLQRFAVQTLQQQLRELDARNVEDGAVLVLDNASGEVLAWVGSCAQTSSAAEVDGVTALRQPGSTLKPFLYAQAIAEHRITAASLLEDSGTQIATPGGLYIPQNYDHHFKGWVSVRTALGASLNVPAVRTLVMVSPDAFQKHLQELGFSLGHGGEYYGYSLALGSAEVSLLQLTNAYRALANLGRVSAPTWQPGAKTGNPIAALDSRAAFIVGDVLSDANARARTFGSDSLLATRFWTAVKTGTSKDMRDNWAVGYSQFYTVGVWVGNASGAPMWDVSGTTGAAPVWAAVMNFLHRNRPSHAPSPPPGLVQVPVRFAALAAGPATAEPLEAQRPEWFLQGTQQVAFAPPAQPQSGRARITAPSSGTVIALDPDIPAHNQRLGFSAVGSGLHWLMDAHEFARGSQAQWLPWPGKHVVQLADSTGTVLDEIRLEVRGAAVRVSAQGARSGGRPPAPY
jgi:penicillin-binding protein 1C